MPSEEWYDERVHGKVLEPGEDSVEPQLFNAEMELLAQLPDPIVNGEGDEVHPFRLADFDAPFGFRWLGISFEKVDDNMVHVKLRGEHELTGQWCITQAEVPVDITGDAALILHMINLSHRDWPRAVKEKRVGR